MVDLFHVDPDDLLLDTFRLGRAVYRTGFRPKHAISIWRGGTPIGLGVDAYFRLQGVHFHHTSVATSSYKGIGLQSDVVVKGLEHVIQSVCPEDGLLIIDDVYETGRTIEKIVKTLRERARRNAPRDIRVATVHRKDRPHIYDELPVIALATLPETTWIDYPHELADLVGPDDPQEARLQAKDGVIPALYEILRTSLVADVPQRELAAPSGAPYTYLSARDLLLDAFRLGANIVRSGYRPDFLVAIWPGGVQPGLGIHEMFKYVARRRGEPEPHIDHVPINTTRTHLSYRHDIIGLDYLIERVEYDHQLLIVDTTFRSGRHVSDVVHALKEGLRRNLDLKKIKIATIYWNPDDKSTWTVRPFKLEPDYYLARIDHALVYPHAVHRLRDPRTELKTLNPRLARILYEDGE